MIFVYAHAIVPDRSGRFVFVPHLGTDQVFQFTFDERSGRLAANTPPLVQLKAGSGPRHLVVSPDNRFAFLLNELTATVTTLAHEDGLLREVDTVSSLPPQSTLRPGMPRPQPKQPRGFLIDPAGCAMVVSGEKSDTISSYRIEPHGQLQHLGKCPTGKGSNWVEIVSFD